MVNKTDSYKEERNKKIVEMSDNYNLQEVANEFGITREAVRLILKSYGIVVSSRKRSTSRVMEKELQEILKYKEFLNYGEKSELIKMGYKEAWIMEAIKKSNINLKLKEVGCKKCITNPYAIGLCKPCYERNRRRNSGG